MSEFLGGFLIVLILNFTNISFTLLLQVALLLVLQHWGYDGFAQHAENVAEFYRMKKDECLKAVEKHLTGKFHL